MSELMDNADEINDSISTEEILKKHRQERKDLQARIQSLKKTSVKGDKKKKKEVTETIIQLEKELEERHALELKNVTPTELSQDESSELILDDEVVTNRVSRAQKRRNKKEIANKEREKRIAEEEKNNRQGPRVIELNTIKEILQNEGLQIFTIPADGNCLYCAINHQLDVTGRTGSNVTKLRKLTATYMQENKEDFLPFMYNDDNEVVDEEKFEKYCKDVANTKLWGGQLELTALSKVLKCPIKIIQASGPTTIQGEAYEGPPLILTYHKHLYRLGEHYNSTTNLVVAQENEFVKDQTF